MSSQADQDRSSKAGGRNDDAYDSGKSHMAIVPENVANGGVPAPEEQPEGRSMTEENSAKPAPDLTQSRTKGLQGLGGVREAAGRDKHLRFNNLLHHITPALLRLSYQQLRRDAAPGVDGQSWEEYGGSAEQFNDLCSRVHRGSYRASPSRRIYIPKADGKKRPIGIAAIEDKIVQQAVRTVLETVYEQDFLDSSYGYRPGRKAHDALDVLEVAISRGQVAWILDADIRSFFDSLDHEWMMKFLEHRLADKRMLRLLSKWLKAGVSEEGQWSPTTKGTPQGAVISPLLANIYLHYVLDLWVRKWCKEKARGKVYIVRYADDFVMGFQFKHEACGFMKDLKERLSRFGLELHEEKTRLIEFGRFAETNRKRRGEGKPESFNFLGFTHVCARARDGKRFKVARRPVAKKLAAKAKQVKGELRKLMHEAPSRAGRYLQQVLRGVYNYYAVPGTAPQLSTFRQTLSKLWIRSLRRRSQRARRKLTWERFQALEEKWLPRVRIVHPYPAHRLRANHPR